METAQKRPYYCPIEVTLDLIGGKWKPLILWHLKEKTVLRNGELRRLIPTISQKMLTQQLRQLEADGLVAREVFAEVPPRVEYALTEYGKELKRLLDQFCDWGEMHAQRFGLEITPPSACHDDAPPSSSA